MTDGTAAPASALTIDQLHARVDAWYREVFGVSALEADAALLTLARLQGEVAALRGQVLRSPSRAMMSFVARELDPLLASLEVQAKLVVRASSIRQGRQR